MTTATPRTTSSKKIVFFYRRISQLYRFVQSNYLSELAQANCVMPALNSKLKYKKLAVAVRVLQTTQNLVISRCCFAEDG